MASGNRIVRFTAILRDAFGTEVSRVILRSVIEDDEHTEMLIAHLEGKYVQSKHVPNYIELEYISG